MQGGQLIVTETYECAQSMAATERVVDNRCSRPTIFRCSQVVDEHLLLETGHGRAELIVLILALLGLGIAGCDRTRRAQSAVSPRQVPESPH